VGWVVHLQDNGFNVKTKEVTGSELISIKERYGVPPSLRTCHTGIVDGYVIEGHVPANLVVRLLKEKPKVTGLGVPGMPGRRPKPYNVLTFDRQGRTKVYDQIRP
jgi:hypothetical protein